MDTVGGVSGSLPVPGLSDPSGITGPSGSTGGVVQDALHAAPPVLEDLNLPQILSLFPQLFPPSETNGMSIAAFINVMNSEHQAWKIQFRADHFLDVEKQKQSHFGFARALAGLFAILQQVDTAFSTSTDLVDANAQSKLDTLNSRLATVSNNFSGALSDLTAKSNAYNAQLIATANVLNDSDATDSDKNNAVSALNNAIHAYNNTNIVKLGNAYAAYISQITADNATITADNVTRVANGDFPLPLYPVPVNPYPTSWPDASRTFLPPFLPFPPNVSAPPESSISAVPPDYNQYLQEIGVYDILQSLTRQLPILYDNSKQNLKATLDPYLRNFLGLSEPVSLYRISPSSRGQGLVGGPGNISQTVKSSGLNNLNLPGILANQNYQAALREQEFQFQRKDALFMQLLLGNAQQSIAEQIAHPTVAALQTPTGKAPAAEGVAFDVAVAASAVSAANQEISGGTLKEAIAVLADEIKKANPDINPSALQEKVNAFVTSVFIIHQLKVAEAAVGNPNFTRSFIELAANAAGIKLPQAGEGSVSFGVRPPTDADITTDVAKRFADGTHEVAQLGKEAYENKFTHAALEQGPDPRHRSLDELLNATRNRTLAEVRPLVGEVKANELANLLTDALFGAPGKPPDNSLFAHLRDQLGAFAASATEAETQHYVRGLQSLENNPEDANNLLAITAPNAYARASLAGIGQDMGDRPGPLGVGSVISKQPI